jgi:Ca2+-binding RTX toxin-like protein
MAKNELDYEDLHDFFERPYQVTERSDGSWLFTSTSDRYDGWTVELAGSGLSGMGIFPEAGTITSVIIKTPAGVVADNVGGLTLSATDLAAQFEFSDHDGTDDHGGDDDLTGDDGNDDLSGHGGDDDLMGADGDDDLSGGGGDDHLSGDDGDDDLHGQGGDDDLGGGSGDDRLSGGGGKDDLSGEEGSDVLKGQGKNDKLDGGADDDLLIGGGGKDVYIFAPNFGDDTIKRFDHGKDKIDLRQTGLSFDDLDIAKDHSDTVITTPEGMITIDHVSGGKTVDDGDFLF